MALAPIANNTRGRFVEEDYGYVFEYCDATEPSPQGWEEYRHWIWVGPNGDQRRWARVLKTRAHVVVDENSDGSPAIQRWYFRTHVQYLKD